MTTHHQLRTTRGPRDVILGRRLLALGVVVGFVAAVIAAGATPTLEQRSYAGEVVRPAAERPRFGEPQEPDYHIYQGFHYTWVVVHGLADAGAERTLNQKLRALIEPAIPKPAQPVRSMPRPTGDDTHPDDYVDVTHAAINAGVLSVVLERGHRNADAPRHMLDTEVYHYDLTSGRELVFSDLFPREHWPAVEQELRRVFDDLNDHYVVYRDDEFPAMADNTSGYFAGGEFHLLVRPNRDTSAVQDQPFLDLPADRFAQWLTPRGRALLAASSGSQRPNERPQ